MTKDQIERLSKKNAIKMIQGRDKLKSWGHSGYYKAKRLRRWFHYRSSIELNVIKVLDEASDYIEDFDTECFYIPYDFKGAQLNYVPDLILKTKNGKTFVIEVKPAAQLEEEKNVAKWATARRWCWKQGCKFFVITDKDWENLIPILQHLENQDGVKAQALMEWQL